VANQVTSIQLVTIALKHKTLFTVGVHRISLAERFQ